MSSQRFSNQKSVMENLRTRLRTEFCSRYAIAGALAVPFVGDVFSRHLGIATVGQNPSCKEHVDDTGKELIGLERRLETLNSLGASLREALTDEQCDQAIKTMRGYFGQGKPYYAKWFNPLRKVLYTIGLPYEEGKAVHLDLIQEAVLVPYVDEEGRPRQGGWAKWEEREGSKAKAQLDLDTRFLLWELQCFPFSAVLCNGRTVWNRVSSLLGAETSLLWTMKTGRNGTGELKCGALMARVNGREIGLIGWNRPLQKAGLTDAQTLKLGEAIRLWLVSNRLI